MKIISDQDLKIVAKGISNILGLEYTPTIYQKAAEEMMQPFAKAYYIVEGSRSRTSVVINTDSIEGVEDFIITLSHELCHSYQNQIGGFYYDAVTINNAFNNDEEIKKELVFYPKEQLLREVDARLFADFFLNKLPEKFLKELEKKMLNYVRQN